MMDYKRIIKSRPAREKIMRVLSFVSDGVMYGSSIASKQDAGLI